MLPATKNTIYFKYLLLIISLSLIGFACAKKPPSEKIAIKISNYTLTAGEFNELFSELNVPEDTPKTREAFLGNLITRKLLLQEAQRLELDKEKDFLRSIENFWEQSLLKIIIDRKTKEIAGDITVTEQEIEDYYNRWARENPDNPKTIDELRDIIRWQLLREKEKLAINSWIEVLKNSTDIKTDKKAIGIE